MDTEFFINKYSSHLLDELYDELAIIKEKLIQSLADGYPIDRLQTCIRIINQLIHTQKYDY